MRRTRTLASIALLVAATVRCADSVAEELPPADPPAELCNGLDDDGDGVPDNGWTCVAGSTRACATPCGTSGIERCNESCAWDPCVPPAEICGNGTDDDCNGLTDVTVPIGENVELAVVGNAPYGVTGGPEGYVIARFEPRSLPMSELVVADFDARGERLAPDKATGFLANLGMNHKELSAARGGGALALAWSFPPRVGQMLVLRDGVSTELRPTPFAVEALDFTTLPPPIVWTGQQFLLAYAYRPSGWAHLSLHAFAADGRELGRDRPVTDPGTYHWDPEVAVAGDSIGVVWHQGQGTGFPSDVYFVHATYERGRLGDIVRLTEPDEGASEPIRNRNPTIAYDGEGFGVAWSRSSTNRGQIQFARITREGRRLGAIRRVAASRSDALYPTLVFTGMEYGLAWLDWNERRTRGQVLFVRLRRDGGVIGRPIVLTETAGHREPKIVWTGHDYGVVFSAGRSATTTVQLSRIGCE